MRQYTATHPSRFTVDMRWLFRDESYEHKWFLSSNVRFLYEILLSTYLPIIQRANIDFKVAIDDGLHDEIDYGNKDEDGIPEAWNNYTKNWVEYLHDDNFMSLSDKIARRCWVVSYTTDFRKINENDRLTRDIETIGHQSLIVLKKRRRSLEANIFIVDNLPEALYKHTVHHWIGTSLKKKLNQKGLHIKYVYPVVNAMPVHYDLGTCMSCSFRAMILFAMLRNPFPYLKIRINDERSFDQHTRFLKLTYVLLERLRFSLLTNQHLFPSEAKTQPYAAMFMPHGRKPIAFNLHDINTPYLFMIRHDILRLCHDMRGDNFFDKQFTSLNPALLKQMRAETVHINRDLRADISDSIRLNGPDDSGPCIVSAEFPSSFFGLYR